MSSLPLSVSTAPVLAHQGLDLGLVEAASRQHHSRTGRGSADGFRAHAGDDRVDVGLEIDAGLVLKLLLTVFLNRDRAAHFLPQFRGHDFVDVRERDDRCVAGDKSELDRAAVTRKRAGREPDVICDHPRAQADAQRQQRNDHEIPRLCRHGTPLKVLYGLRLIIVQEHTRVARRLVPKTRAPRR
jgi:hypothetical protein